MIPDKFLKQVNPIKAINYHDSLLPKYAGLNSTTWAILNDEETHGVTWHKITNGIDEGDIYYQNKITIDKTDTIFELNLKCVQAAFSGFIEVITNIERNNLLGIKQDLSKRSYYGMNFIPNNYGFISLNTNTSYLNRLLKSLSFGKEYYNAVATAKVKIYNEYYIIEYDSTDREVREFNLKELPLLNIYGKHPKISADFDKVEDFTLTEEELTFFKKLKNFEFQIFNKINDVFYNLNSSGERKNHIFSGSKDEYKITTKISFNKLCVFLRIILSQLLPDASILKVYHKQNESDIELTDVIKHTTENISILSLKSETLSLLYNKLCEKTFAELNNKFELMKDFGYRYNINLCSEFAVVNGYDGPLDEHDIIFFIEDENVRVRYNKNNHDFLNTIINSIEVLAEIETRLVDTNILVNSISILSKLDYEKVIKTWNKTDVAYPEDKTIHGMFEEQVSRTPDNIAVIEHDNTIYTYKQLQSDAKLLAKHIVNSRNTLVGVLSEKGYNQVVSTLGVMQSGHGYLPLNIDWPIERIVEVLESGQVKVVLLSRDQARNKKLYATLSKRFELLVIEDTLSLLRGGIKSLTEVNAIELPEVGSTDIAYVIFTSGSTGKPKGVTISHHGALNTIYAVNEEFKISESDRVLALSELSFDLSVYDIFGLLCVGGAIVFPAHDNLKNSNHWLELVEKYDVTIWNTVPQLADLLIDAASDKHNGKVRLFLLSGDWIPLHLPDRIKNIYPQSTVISLGGATEGSIWSIWYKVDNVCSQWSSIPYGIAMPNQKIYILNQALNTSPIGSVGDIYIGGAGVALNYWNDSEKTEKSFIEHPILGRLYRTGDCGRWNQNGYVEFIGRNDFQVKIRGFRIELGEIESTLSSYREVKQSVVLALENKAISSSSNNKYLVCYYVAEHKLDEEAMYEYLASNLPDYMVPSVLVYLDKLPLTINGKLDRNALPVPEFRSEDEYVVPRNELEFKVSAIFAEVLGLPQDKVGIKDDFFKLGGNSIVSIQLVSRLRQRLSLMLTVKDVFSYKTIEQLVDNVIGKQLLENNKSKSELLTEHGIVTGDSELLSIQEWFFDNVDAGLITKPGHWNQSFMIRTPLLDIDLLKESINKLVAYHDALRFNYKRIDSKVKQYYNVSDNLKINLNYLDIKDLVEHENSQELTEKLYAILTSWQDGFNLIDNSRLYSVGYITGYADNSSRIFFAFHHLIIDTVSWRIIVEDLRTIYTTLELAKSNNQLKQALSQSSEQILGLKGTSYRQWTTAIKGYGATHSHELKYWNSQLCDLEVTNKNLDKLVKNVRAKNFSSFEIDEDLTNKLLTVSNNSYNTQINDLLLTAFGLALSDVTGSDVNHILLEGHGREEIAPNLDVTHTVGWFTTMYPVRLHVSKDTISTSVIQVKETLRQVPNKGIGFGALLGYKNANLPRITFNYLGQFDNTAELNWNIVSEMSGLTVASENDDYNIINVNAIVINKKLKVDLIGKIDLENITELNSRFDYYLNTLLCHLLNVPSTKYTMSDFEDYEVYTIINNTSNHESEYLFILPPGDCGYEAYINTLAPLLTAHQVVLFNNFNVYASQKIPDYASTLTHEELADLYIAYIKHIQPKGTYRLFGWSFGGVLSFEIARKILACGDKISSLFMLDSLFNLSDYYNLSKERVLESNRINYIYNPSNEVDFSGTRVILLKAISPLNEPENENSNLFDYYALNTSHNCLDKIINKDLIEVVHLKANHISWIKDTEILNYIAKLLNGN